ncbi:MAG: O-antigen ligase family protein [Bacteroidota bacterium]
MLSGLLGQKRVYFLLLLCYAALAFGLPFNKVVLSLATMLSALIVLLDFDRKAYAARIRENAPIKLLLLFLAFHLLSALWTTNFTYFLFDLNAKLPFYVIPLVLVLKPVVNKRDYLLIFGVFLASVAFFSAWNFISYFVWRKSEFSDMRDMSRFISHIRFGLMIVFGIVLCVFWLIRQELRHKWIALLLICWFLTYTYFSEVFSSYAILLGILIIALLFAIQRGRYRKLMNLAFLGLMGFVVAFVVFTFISFRQQHIKPKAEDLPEKTAEGYYYLHDLSSNSFINGHHVYSYICDPELTREWEKVSRFRLRDTNRFGYEHYYILIQYMTSKGLKKDAQGFSRLTENDIRRIEQGHHVSFEAEVGFMNRFHTLIDEFTDDDPNGKTVLQRVEFLKTGMHIFQKNWLFGVGSGDLADAFAAEYKNSKTRLKEENQLRTHNQVLTYFISFGIIGGIIFLLLILVSFVYFYRHRLPLAFLFLAIIVLSFLSEDTLETQMGATFFALFFGLFIAQGNINLTADPNEA